MPLVNPRDRPNKKPDPAKLVTQPAVASPEYRTVSVDTRHTPRSSLLTYIQGKSWTVDYYGQVFDRDNELSGQQRGKPADQQQYRRIPNLEFKVSSALEEGTSQESDTKSMNVVGASAVYAPVIPQHGDMFVGDIGGGRAGVFQVTNVTRMSLFKNTVHTIEYLLIDYADSYMADLLKKTTVTHYFVKDFLHYGRDPLLIEEDWNSLHEMQMSYEDLVSLYFDDFYSDKFQTLLVPDQAQTTYDPYMVDFLRDVIGVQENEYMRKIRVLNVNAQRVSRNKTVLDAIKELSSGMLPSVVYTMQLQSTAQFKSHIMFNGIYHSGIADVVFPAEGRTDVDAYYEDRLGVPEATGGIKRSRARVKDLRRLIQSQDVGDFSKLEKEPDPNELPDIHRVADDPYYIFTKRFYISRDGQRSSKIELEVHKLLKGQPLNLAVIQKLANTAKYWDNLERFYLIPVLFVLLKVAYRTEA